MCARATPMATAIHCMQAISTVTGPPAPAGVWQLTCLPTTPVSYTHLDVYKRQTIVFIIVPVLVTSLAFALYFIFLATIPLLAAKLIWLPLS